MWTRNRTEDGKFSYSLYSLTGEHVETVGGFATHTEADEAGQIAQRVDLFGKPTITLGEILDSMTDDELLAELMV